MNRFIRSLFSVGMLALIVLYVNVSQRNIPTLSCLLLLGFLYLLLIWAPLNWWTSPKYTLLTILAISLTEILYLSNRNKNIPTGLLLVPLILLLAREQKNYRGMVTGLAIFSMIAMFILSLNSPIIWTAMPVIIALYMSIRAINIYKEAYRLSQQYVEELHVAHEELQQTYTALQKATTQSMRYAALAERTRLARDIHDGLGHQLTSLIVQLQALEIMLPNDPTQASKVIPDLLEVARNAMAEVHLAIRTWREDEINDGLVAMQGLISRYKSQVPFTVEFNQDLELSSWPVEISTALYRTLQEALTNVMRHAKATTVSVYLKEFNGQVMLTILDDGFYTENTTLNPGYGIRGMRERCKSLGGSCRFSRNEPHGLKIQAQIPLLTHSNGEGKE